MKGIIMAAACMAMCTISLAQSQPGPSTGQTYILSDKQLLIGKLSWGVKAGLSYSNLYGKEIDYIFAGDRSQYRPGFHAGIYVDTRMSRGFGLKHELLFNQRRVAVSVSDGINGDYGSKLTMSYLDLMPASLTFYKGGFHLYGGPYISALLGANVRRRDENGRAFRDKSIFGDPGNGEAETRYLQKFDFGTNLGLVYRFGFGLSIGARYTHGFTDIFQYANSYTNEDPKTDNIKIYNRGWMLSIGYAFGNSKR